MLAERMICCDSSSQHSYYKGTCGLPELTLLAHFCFAFQGGFLSSLTHQLP